MKDSFTNQTGGGNVRKIVSGVVWVVSLAYYPLLGRPLIFWFGRLTFILLAPFLTGYLLRKGWRRIPFRAHVILARITLLVASIHTLLGILTV